MGGEFESRVTISNLVLTSYVLLVHTPTLSDCICFCQWQASDLPVVHFSLAGFGTVSWLSPEPVLVKFHYGHRKRSYKSDWTVRNRKWMAAHTDTMKAIFNHAAACGLCYYKINERKRTWLRKRLGLLSLMHCTEIYHIRCRNTHPNTALSTFGVVVSLIFSVSCSRLKRPSCYCWRIRIHVIWSVGKVSSHGTWKLRREDWLVDWNRSWTIFTANFMIKKRDTSTVPPLRKEA